MIRSSLPSPSRGTVRPARWSRSASRAAIAFLTFPLLWPAYLSAQVATLSGQVVDRISGRPVIDAGVELLATPHQTLTDERGRFRLDGVATGKYRLRVSHVAYGQQSIEVEVVAGATVLRIEVSETAIVLEPVTAEVRSVDETRARAAGVGRKVVTREQIAASEGTNMRLPDVLRQVVPSVRVRRVDSLAGSRTCIELRTIRSMSSVGQCLSPAVYLDGVPISSPTTLYDNIELRTLESMEVIPATEAGVRFGSGALHGALLINTRRPGLASTSQPQTVLRNPNFDWSTESRGHRTALVLLSSFAGNAVGVALGTIAARQCLSLREPANDRIISECSALPTLGAAASALVLPSLGSSLASGWAGRTDMSRGRFGPATMGAAMAIIPGYALILSAQRSQSRNEELVGYGLTVLGAPLLATAADYLFRKLRGEAPESR